MKSFHTFTRAPTRVRGEDAWGSGAFEAPRGERVHRGVDIVVEPGDEILAPFDGTVVREAAPYDDDTRFSGLLLRGCGDWHGCEVKVFYVTGTATGPIRAGQPIGRAQRISEKYPGITEHIHVEVRWHGELADPTSLV